MDSHYRHQIFMNLMEHEDIQSRLVHALDKLDARDRTIDHCNKVEKQLLDDLAKKEEQYQDADADRKRYLKMFEQKQQQLEEF